MNESFEPDLPLMPEASPEQDEKSFFSGFLRHMGGLSREVIIYGLGGMAGQLMAFFIVPVLTRTFSIGEYGTLALCAMELGIPSIFAAGEKAFAEEAEALTPGVVTVAVKRGLRPDDGHAYATPEEYSNAKLAAEHLTPAAARKQIRAGAKLAVEHLKKNPAQFRYPGLKAPWHIIRRFRPLGTGLIQHAKDDQSFITAMNRL